jgi:trk system potassium uptake protein TrkA
MKNSIAVLGMGRFGQFLTAALSRDGADVLIADNDEETIRKYANLVSCAVKADLNDPEVIRGLGLSGVDTVVVAMGSSLDASIMCVMVAKELGVPRVIAKAASLRMGEILRRVGADEIIYPEKESAELTARRLMSSDFLDFFNLGSELSVFSMKPKKDWIGKSLRELRLRDRYQLNVIAIRENGRTSATMDPDQPIAAHSEIFAVAKQDDMDRILH